MPVFDSAELLRRHHNDEQVLQTLAAAARAGTACTEKDRLELFGAIFDRSSERQAEFRSKDIYSGYMEARFRGRVKIHGGPLAGL